MDFRFDFRRYSLPFRHAVRTSRGSWPVREGILLRVGRPDGSAFFGEAAPVPSFARETVDEDEAACSALGERIGDQALSQVPRNLCALRNGLADAMGGLDDVPRHDSLPVAALLPSGRAAFADAPPKAEAGFRVFKWKVGVGSADDEMAMLDDLVGALPASAKIRLDANGAWDRRTAGRWLAHASERPVEFVEQPVAPDSKGAQDCLAGLSADYPVPIALDESLANASDVRRWLDSGWHGYFVIKPSLLGEARGALAMLAEAQARVVFSSALETAVGARSALRMAFAWRGRMSALGFGVWPLFSDPRFDGPPAAPFLRADDVDRINPEDLWNAAN
jgi:O-succinylbenzoate synthase